MAIPASRTRASRARRRSPRSAAAASRQIIGTTKSTYRGTHNDDVTNETAISTTGGSVASTASSRMTCRSGQRTASAMPISSSPAAADPKIAPGAAQTWSRLIAGIQSS